MGISAVEQQPKTPPQSPMTYEALRNKKLEENKRKLEELNLRHLSAALKLDTAAKTSPAKVVKRRIMHEGPSTPARRSLRIATLPEACYREVLADDVLERSGVRRYTSKRRDLSGRVYASDEVREYAIAEAEKVESELDPAFPSFVKPMLQSHTTGGFWLGLPTQFCRRHMPRSDTRIVLVNENDEEFDTLYLANKRGLSGGWRGFSLHHELVDGDALVFHLIKPTTFKVILLYLVGDLYHPRE